MKIENWYICSTDSPYTAPELCRRRVGGKVYGNPNFNDGDDMISSPLVELDLKNRIAKTKSGSVYELGAADNKWLEWLDEVGYKMSDFAN